MQLERDYGGLSQCHRAPARVGAAAFYREACRVTPNTSTLPKSPAAGVGSRSVLTSEEVFLGTLLNPEGLKALHPDLSTSKQPLP